MPEPLKNIRGQALLLVTVLMMILSLLCITAFTLTGTEKLTVKGSVEEAQAYYVADAAMERVLTILKDNAGVLEQLNLNLTYGKPQLEALLRNLSGQDNASVQGLIGLFNSSYRTVEILQEDGAAYNPAQNTMAGTIHSISLTKTAEDSNAYKLRLETTGSYGSAKRTLLANVMISSPINSFSGILVQNTPTFNDNSVIEAPLTALTDVEFSNGSFFGNVYIQGNCIMRENTRLMTTGEMVVLGNTTIDTGAQLEGELKSKGDVLINGDVLGGPVRSDGEVTVGLGHVGHPVTSDGGTTEWDGEIFATGSISTASTDSFGTAYPQTPQSISCSFPEFPEVDGSWYAKNCDYYYSGNQMIRAEDLLPGIYYIAGDVIISGYYQGNVTIVAAGNISVSNSASLKAKKPGEDSLQLMALGDIQFHEQALVDALVYSSRTIELAHHARLTGSVIARDFGCNGATVIYDSALCSLHPPWVTTEIRILSWQEKYPVIPVD